MSRDLYEALFRPDEAAMINEDAELLSLFASTAAALRAWRADSLAEAELNDALYVEEEDEAGAGADRSGAATDGPLRLAAADDDAELDFPVRYGAAGWRLRLGLSVAGVPYALLEVAPSAPVRLLLPGEPAISLEIGVPFALPALLAPPAAVQALSGVGPMITLRPVADDG